MTDSDDPVLTKDERIEQFGEEYVKHSEWWIDQLDLMEDVQDDVLDAIDDRDDARVVKRGSSTSHSGKHTLSFTVNVAGEPWEGGDA